MLECCDERILYLVQDSLVEVFGILDECCEEHTAAFLGVLHSLVSCMKRWQAVEAATKPHLPGVPLAAGTHGDSGGQGRSDEGEGDGHGIAYDDDGKRVWSAEEQMQHSVVAQILERCPHFLGHSNARCQLICLEIVGKAMVLLQVNEDVLLPLIHGSWPSIVLRLRDLNPIVQMAAMRATVDLARAAPSFVLQRICAEAVPAMCQVLSTLHAGQGPGSWSLSERHTRGYKVKMCALQVLRDLVQRLGLGAQPASAAVIMRTVSVLAHRTPRRPGTHTPPGHKPTAKAANTDGGLAGTTPLDTLVVGILRSLATDDPDGVWFQLMQSHPPAQLHPPHPTFRSPRLNPNLPAPQDDAVRKLLCDLQTRQA